MLVFILLLKILNIPTKLPLNKTRLLLLNLVLKTLIQLAYQFPFHQAMKDPKEKGT